MTEMRIKFSSEYLAAVEQENAEYLAEKRREEKRRPEAKLPRPEAKQLRQDFGNRDATILRWIKEGKRHADIAKEFNISNCRVGQICREQAAKEAKKEEQARQRETFRILLKEAQTAKTLQNLRIITEALKAKAEIIRQWQQSRHNCA